MVPDLPCEESHYAGFVSAYEKATYIANFIFRFPKKFIFQRWISLCFFPLLIGPTQTSVGSKYQVRLFGNRSAGSTVASKFGDIVVEKRLDEKSWLKIMRVFPCLVGNYG